jgi:hypothetical protein
MENTTIKDKLLIEEFNNFELEPIELFSSEEYYELEPVELNILENKNSDTTSLPNECSTLKLVKIFDCKINSTPSNNIRQTCQLEKTRALPLTLRKSLLYQQVVNQ